MALGGDRLSRKRSPSPAKLQIELERAIDDAQDFIFLARSLSDLYEEGFDFGHDSASGGSMAPARTSWVKTDPTGDTAVSGRHIEIRRRIHKAAGYAHKAAGNLELARGELLEAFFNSDQSDAMRALVREAWEENRQATGSA